MTSPRDRRVRQLASLYATFGDAATWSAAGGGPAASVTVRWRDGDGEAAFGSSAVLAPKQFVRVRSSEVAEPQRGDLVEIEETGQVLKVIADPALERNGGEWSCEVAEVHV